MTQTPAHQWIAPKLAELLAEAEKAGIARDVAVAVLTDLIDDPQFSKPGPPADRN